jgi:hypothetical protein
MWGHRHDKLYPGRTNYEFDLMQPPKDPKEKRRWKKIRWLLLATIVLILCGIVVKWEEWVAGDDPDFIVGELAWPGFDHREKVFTLRCHNNCSDHATISPCDPTNQTYCTCDRGYLGFDCSLALCTKCRIPDVVIIGVQKGGTTALNHYLRFNPAFMLGQKDHFFDEHWDRGLVWYFSLWDYSRDILNEPVDSSIEGGEDDDATYESLELNDEEQILTTETNEEKDKDREEARDPEELEVEHDVEKEDLLADTPLSVKQRIKVGGSPKYIIDDIAMEKLYALHPSVKFIVLLRNPTTRAYSGALMNERKGFFSHVLTEDEKGLLGSLWRDLRQERRRMSKSQSEQEAIEEALATDGELVFEGTIDLNDPSNSSSRKLLSVPETAEIRQAKEALKAKLAEYNSKPFTPEETEKVLLRAVEVATACIEEARRVGGSSSSSSSSFFLLILSSLPSLLS